MKWVLFAVTVPAALVCWLVGYFSLMLFVTKTPRWENFLVLSLEIRPWAAKYWKYSTTAPRLIVYRPGTRDFSTGTNTIVERHEHVHIRQIEDSMFISFLLGLGVLLVTQNLLLSTVIWLSGSTWLLFYYVTAAMRYGIKNAYFYAEHEASAYAQTDLCAQLNKSWQEVRETTSRF